MADESYREERVHLSCLIFLSRSAMEPGGESPLPTYRPVLRRKPCLSLYKRPVAGFRCQVALPGEAEDRAES